MCGAVPPLCPFMTCTGTTFPQKNRETQTVIMREIKKLTKYCAEYGVRVRNVDKI
jgi:hypothetical protein